MFKARTFLQNLQGKKDKDVHNTGGRGRGQPLPYDENPWNTTPSYPPSWENYNTLNITQGLLAGIRDDTISTFHENTVHHLDAEIKKRVTSQAEDAKKIIDKHLLGSAGVKTCLAVARNTVVLSQVIPEQLSHLLDWYIDGHARALKFEEDDELYQPVIRFIRERIPPDQRGSGTVKTAEDLKGDADSDDSNFSTAVVSFQKSGLSIIRDIDLNGGQRFEYKGESFWAIKQDGTIRVWHMSRTTIKIEEMIADIYAVEIERKKKTCVQMYRAVPAHGMFQWREEKSAVKRDIDCVCLKSRDRTNILAGLDYYCSPDAALYYLRRGIPMRKGLLLYGPPGTGKTSLVHALASRYELKVRVVSISAPNMTDDGLAELFNQVGRGDLVLFEDIDCDGSTGQRRSMAQEPASESASEISDSEDDENEDDEDDEDEQYYTTTEPSSRPRSMPENSTHRTRGTRNVRSPANEQPWADGQPKANGHPKPKSQVTLSGLLNVLDGANSPEGHVVVMTTNHLENLDEALTRAGRTEVKVKLDYADREQLRDLFRLIFMPMPGENPSYDATLIPDMAEQFARMVPEGAFTPAEVTKGYLISYFPQPHRALENVSDWLQQNRRKLRRRGVRIPRQSARPSQHVQDTIPTQQSRLEALQSADSRDIQDYGSQSRQEVQDVEIDSARSCGHDIRSAVNDDTTNRAVDSRARKNNLQNQANATPPLVARSGTNGSSILFAEPQREQTASSNLLIGQIQQVEGLSVRQPIPLNEFEHVTQDRRDQPGLVLEGEHRCWASLLIDRLFDGFPEGVWI